MMKLWRKWLWLVFIASQTTACGTIVSLSNSDDGIYSGVSKDFEIIKDGGILSVAAVIDLPLSFVLDTLLLPVTLTR